MSLEEENYPSEEACLPHQADEQNHASEGDSTSFKDEKNLAGTSSSPNDSVSTGTGSNGTVFIGLFDCFLDVDAENDPGQDATPRQTEEVQTQSAELSHGGKTPVTSL